MRNTSILASLVGFILVALARVSAYAEPGHDFAKWEKEIAAYEQADKTNPPPKNAALFIGSSTIKRWITLAQDFPEHKVFNCGFGGSQIIDSTHFAERLIFPHQPRQIFLRAGGNDLNAGKSPEEVFGDFKDFVTKVQAKLPETELVFISVSHTPKRWELAPKEKAFNALVRDFIAGKPRMKYIETGEMALGADGKPREELFVEDKLHFNAEGYKLLTAKVRPYLTSTQAAQTQSSQPTKKLVLVAGKPSHPPRMHEFNAGAQLLAKCLHDFPGLRTEVVLSGWPKDEQVFEGADAVVFYMDGGAKHEAVQEGKRRLTLIDGWTKKGVGIGCMHYGVEVVADQAGEEFKRWIGGHYENMFSCNPMWEPQFASFPDHPITRGVKPFAIKDEWYFNMRFVSGISGNKATEAAGLKFTPILVAAPSDEVRNGPYVAPKGPYPHIQAEKGRAEAMMWAVERPDGGRGFGFTGGHFHDNWANEDFRKVTLNALVWLAKAEVPPGGVTSSVSMEELNANLDPKPARK